MAFISMTAILAVLKMGSSSVFDRRNDPQFWTVDIETMGEPRRKGTVTGVSLEKLGLMLTIEDKGNELVLAAVPAAASKTKVLVNGEHDPDAAMVFDPKPSLGNPTRFAFDFKRVTVEDEDHRYNFRYDP